jgi:hypothetical protein
MRHQIQSPAKKAEHQLNNKFIPTIPILTYFDPEAMISNITLSISIGYFRIKTNFLLKNIVS